MIPVMFRKAVSGGPTPPPLSSDILAYYEATSNTTLSGSPAANYGTISSWLPVAGSGGLAQGTSGNRLRLRSITSRPVVYSATDESSRTMADTTLVIDKQDCSIFLLVELGILMANSVASSQTLISFTGGELYVYKAIGAYFRVAWKDGTGTYVSSLVPASSLNLIGVTLSTGTVVVHCNGQSETLAAVALAAGTVTGFAINNGTLAYGDSTGYSAIVIYDHAFDSGELAEVMKWGRGRAIYIGDSEITQHIFGAGASRSCMHYAEGKLDHILQLSLEGRRLHGICGFPGTTIAGSQSLGSVPLALNNPPGTAFNRSTATQVVILESATGDVVADGVEATIITNMTAYRALLRQYGYFVVHNAMAPIEGWNASRLTKMANLNTAMAALDPRRYGVHVPLPPELSDPTNRTYFTTDGTHYTKATGDVLKALNKPYVDEYYSRTLTTLKASWPLNGDYLDDSGYDRDLVALNSPTFVAGLGGKQCLLCATTGNHAARTALGGREYDAPELTVTAWFKVSSLGNTEYIVCKQSGTGGSKNWALYKKWNNKIVAAMSDVSVIELETSFTVTTNTWYGVGMIIDATNGLRLYVTDAGGDPATFALRGTSAWAGSPVLPNSGPLRVGCSDDASCSNIYVQKPQMRFEALSLAQLQALTY